MKPFSERTTPRRLMAPISRHFLPVLQPEPPAWLTTGLMKGSRLPFALYLLSGATCCSLAAFSPSPLPEAPLPATVAAAGGLLWGTSADGFAGALSITATAETRFLAPGCFTPTGLAPARNEEDFAGVTTATPLDLTGA